MRFGSLFAGVGGFDLGLERAGMRCAWQIEIDEACRRVLAARFRSAGRYADVCAVDPGRLDAVDLICGGFPCQDVSVAGRRAGLAGERSGLFFEFVRLVAALTPRWVLVENVPGLLTSCGCAECRASVSRAAAELETDEQALLEDEEATARATLPDHRGRDMAIVLGTLADLGYGWSYRVLDAQYFGVAQRRRRVFIVGHLGDGQRAARVLLEPESGAGNTAPRRPSRAIAAGNLARSLGAVGGGNDYGANKGTLIVAKPLTAAEHGPRFCSEDDTFVVAHTLTAEGADASEDGTGRGVPIVVNARQVPVTSEVAQPLDTDGFSQAVHVYRKAQKAHDADDAERWEEDDASATLDAAGHAARTAAAIVAAVGVRRLMPVECERLQGFPDDWTAGQSDSVRYRQLGNAVCVPVAAWIGRRIVENS